MKAEDLRIGNKVNLHGTVATIQTNDFGGGNGIAVLSGKPIPLTVDWFLLFGFETDEMTYWLPDFQTIQIGHFGGSDNGQFVPLYKGALTAQFDNELMYVHELQNFYHGLGRPLTQ